MRVLLCPDSFKGSMSAVEFCKYAVSWIHEAHPEWEVISVPMADGGEGSLDALLPYLNQPILKTEATENANHQAIETDYFISDGVAYIELAKASGLGLIERHQRNILRANTYGTGLLIKDAISEKVKEIKLFAGGSATLDGGTGIMQALGAEFIDGQGKILPNDINVLPLAADIHLGSFILPHSIEITIVCDVNNPLFGPLGAAYIFGPQKGAGPTEISMLDKGLQRFSQILSAKNNDINPNQPGMGAAGGIALAFSGLNSQLIPGASFFIQNTQLEEKIEGSDLIITGEGRYDQQSMMGKITGEIIKISKRLNRKTAVICGSSTQYDDVNTKVIAFDQFKGHIEDSFSNPAKYLGLALSLL